MFTSPRRRCRSNRSGRRGRLKTPQLSFRFALPSNQGELTIPFLTNGDIVRLDLYCKCETQQSITRLKYRVLNTVGLGITDQDACDQLSAVAGALLKDWMSPNAAYLGCRFQIERLVKRPYVSSIVGAGSGAVVGLTLPSQASGLIKWKTALTGRTERGRSYLPFLSDVYLGGTNSVDAAGLVKLDNFAQFYAIAITLNDGMGNSNQFQGIIDSKGSPSHVPPIPAHASDVTGYQVVKRFATQRRRSNINKSDTFGP